MISTTQELVGIRALPFKLKPVPVERTALQTAIGLAWVGLSAAAVWAVGPQLWQRWFAPWGSSSGAALLLLALGMWLYLLTAPGRGPIRAAPARGWLLAAVLLVPAYIVACWNAPQLLRCEFAAAIVGSVMMGTLAPRHRTTGLGVFVLMLLCVHVATSLDFFIGFPLRLLSSQVAGLLLGPRAHAIGAGLSDGSTTYYVDAPCSGVKMLTASIATGAGLAVLYQLNAHRTVVLIASSFALAIFGNAHRAATLFITGVRPDAPLHEIIGVIVFAECAGLLLLIASSLKRRQKNPIRSSASGFQASASRLLAVSFVMGCVVAAASPALTPKEFTPTPRVGVDVVWPTTWNGQALHPVPVPDGMKTWLDKVPGQWAQFRVGDGPQRVLLRLCTGAMRDLHSAQNCYLAQGGTCKPEPSYRDADSRLWSSFTYTDPNGTRSKVRECYVALDEHDDGGDLSDWLRGAASWPDASAWYWSAALPGSTVETTLAITVVL